MLKDILFFEWRFWFKRPITYIFPLIVFVMSLLSFTVDGITLGNDITFRNSPSTLMMIYMLVFFLLPLFTSSFVSSAVSRDFENHFDQILYSMPAKRFNLLFGRFLGGVVVVSFIFFGIIFADLIAKFMPWTKDNLLGPFQWKAHVEYYFLFVLPNVFIVGAILFAVTAKTKNNTLAFLTAIVIVVFYLTFLSLSNEMDNKFLAGLFDPFGIIAGLNQTDKWTAFEKNNNLLKLTSNLVANRTLWLSIAALLWVWAFKTFRIDKKSKAKKEATEEQPFKPVLLKKSVPEFTFQSSVKNILNQAWNDYRNIIKSPSFLVVIGLMVMMLTLQIVGMVQMDRAGRIATTNNTIVFLTAVNAILNMAMIFFAGTLIWKERDAKMNDIYDALPHHTAASFLGKIVSLFYVCISFFLVLILIGVGYQLAHRITNIDFLHYAQHYFGKELLMKMCIGILALFFQIVFNNKYLAFFVSGILLLVEPFIFKYFKLQTNLISITPKLPKVIYSDFYGYGPYAKGLIAFGIYWALFYALLASVAYLFFIRGHQNSWREKWQEAKSRFREVRVYLVTILVVFLGYTSFLVYETQFKNHYLSTKDENKWRGIYEKKYKHLQDINSPKLTNVNYHIDLFPSERKYAVSGSFTLKNKSALPIDTLYFNNSETFPFLLEIPEAKLVCEDKNSTTSFQTYKLLKPMQAGDSIQVSYSYKEGYEGIENAISNDRLLPNGTFLDYSYFMPVMGYNQENELTDKTDREEQGLPPKIESMPALERNCTTHCMKDYIGGMGDWVTIHAVVSTEADQTAIAPGSLVKKWQDKNRNYFEYHLDHPSKFFFSIASGRFEVAKDMANGVQCEVYYIPAHKDNVPEMLKALKKSILYYSEQFGAYQHKQARIIEFPQFASFAQAFPGTMPYSEGIGFTTDILGNKNDINEVFHVVAHEMAHQWWAHQVTGARMQGATLLSESLAEYSSLQLLQKEYGIDMSTKFLKDGNNGYIFQRAAETKQESSLLKVDNQSYIHYQKGGQVLFGIQQILGEKNMHDVLKDLATNFAYKEPPYPTSYELYDRILAITPDSFKYFVRDGFEGIVIFNNEILEAKTTQLANKKYETKIKFQVVKNAGDPSAKESKDLNKLLLGQSKEVPTQDYFDLMLFDENDKGKRYGKVLASQRIKIVKKENEYSFITDKKPYKAVLDPYFMYIHKDPEMNIKKVSG